jgi:acetolactate decarboxylase
MAPWLVWGCQSAHVTPRQRYADTITHAGVIHDLGKGRYDGFMSASNLLHFGDHGLGTFHALDGEMIVHSGVVYRAAIDGSVTVASLSNLVPFSVISYFEPERLFDIERVGAERFQRAIDLHRKSDLPEAIQVQGRFAAITLRSVPAQTSPYRPLSQALEATAHSWALTNVAGMMIGFYYPEAFNALHPAGYHFHFLDSGKTIGGHVLDFSIDQARVAIDTSSKLNVILPTNRPVVRVIQPVTRPRNK